MFKHLLARLPERAVLSQQDAPYLLSLNVRFPDRSSLTNDWRHTTLYLFCIAVCSSDWLRQQRTQLPVEQQKVGPSFLVSRYFGSEESPHAANCAQRSRKFYLSPNTPKGSVGLNVKVPLGLFFPPVSSPNSCDIRLGCCSQLLQRAANSVANYPANSTVNHWIARMISKHHLLSPGSAAD